MMIVKYLIKDCLYFVSVEFEQIVALSIFDVNNILIDNDNTKIKREYLNFE